MTYTQELDGVVAEQLYRCSGAPGCVQDGCSAFHPRRHIPYGANPPPWYCESAGGDVRPVLEGTPRAPISQPTDELAAIENARPWTYITNDPATLPQRDTVVDAAWENGSGDRIAIVSWIDPFPQGVFWVNEYDNIRNTLGWCVYAWRPPREVEAPPLKPFDNKEEKQCQ